MCPCRGAQEQNRRIEADLLHCHVAVFLPVSDPFVFCGYSFVSFFVCVFFFFSFFSAEFFELLTMLSMGAVAEGGDGG